MTTTTRDIVARALAQGHQALTPSEARAVCEEYGIAVPGDALATSPAEAARAATAMGFPVVLKIVSPQILHKTEVGGVRVGLTSAEDVEKAYSEIVERARAAVPDAEIEGVQVQQQVEGGLEVIVGGVTDPSFGRLVAFGLGGVLVEVVKDVTFRLAPLADGEAQSMLESIKGSQLLQGFRGSPPADTVALVSTIEAVSRLVTDVPEIDELDLNPVLARPDGAIALDVRITLRAEPPIAAVPADVGRDPRRHGADHEAAGRGRHRRLGRGRQDRQLRHEEPHQRRLPGRDLPRAPKGGRDPRPQGLPECARHPRRRRCRRVRHPRPVRGGHAGRARQEERAGCRPHPVRFRRGGRGGPAAGARRGCTHQQRAGDGAEHLRLLLHAEQPLRDVLHALRRQGRDGAVVTERRRRHVDHRLQPLDRHGRVGHRRSRQQGRSRRG